ncbi:hypothetical protein SAMN05421665_1069 [Yoonia rosea]|uniref:Uncharacterized protein n=1 Tax=Yoonia rosea TaxID=287098 RepID=A0A1R3WRQ3_9RHOB|nr:hypothetical protein SAMN05421665_1069 [Yoonia rosea]
MQFTIRGEYACRPKESVTNGGTSVYGCMLCFAERCSRLMRIAPC